MYITKDLMYGFSHLCHTFKFFLFLLRLGLVSDVRIRCEILQVVVKLFNHSRTPPKEKKEKKYSQDKQKSQKIQQT